ncbi:MAG: hypothetical protein HC794_01180 [Nitrospiraceae bacterium]|nr:hypothetical protein [Nitrospiraceae bacterium]
MTHTKPRKQYKLPNSMIFTPSDPIQMNREAWLLLLDALESYRCLLHASKMYHEARTVKAIMTGVPTCIPYEAQWHPSEWALISQALRPLGFDGFAPGSREARWYALYQRLRRKGYGRVGTKA